eukprot:scaffold18987_cov109-Isochrysis_galbana.AAC.17
MAIYSSWLGAQNPEPEAARHTSAPAAARAMYTTTHTYASCELYKQLETTPVAHNARRECVFVDAGASAGAPDGG